MQTLIEGILNWKTTIAGVLVFIVGVVPDLILVLTDFQAVLLELTKVLNGDIFALAAIKSTLASFVASIILVYSKNWGKGGE
jgi:hypothetical protein